jgi:hypothetical protein
LPLKPEDLTRVRSIEALVDDMPVRCITTVECAGDEHSHSLQATTPQINPDSLAEQCTWTGKFKDLKFHLEHDCGWALVTCPLLECHDVIQRRKLQEHMDSCDYREVRCDYCGLFQQYHRLRSHLQQCDSMQDYSCSQCGAVIPMHQKAFHDASSCPMARVHCPFEQFGCQIQSPQRGNEQGRSGDGEAAVLSAGAGGTGGVACGGGIGGGCLLRKDYEAHQVEFAVKHSELMASRLNEVQSTCERRNAGLMKKLEGLEQQLEQIRAIRTLSAEVAHGLEPSTVCPP